MATPTDFQFGDGEPIVTGGDDGASGDAFGGTSLGGIGGTTDGSGSGSNIRDANGTEFDPSKHSNPGRFNADGSFRNRRQRRGGGGASSAARGGTTKKADYSSSVDGLSNVLMVIHAGLASVLKIPEIALARDEATPLAGSLASVLEEFDIPVDRKTQVIVGLIAVGAATYGPRFYLYNERMKREKNKPANSTAKVVTIDGIEYPAPEGFAS